MRHSDVAALEIFHDLKCHFHASGQEYGSAGTIVGLFFHDLMVHFTGILIHRDTKNEYGEELMFPFVNQTYAKEPFEISNFKQESQRRDLFLTRIKRMPLLPFGIGQAIPMSLGRDKLEKVVLSVLGYSHGPTRAFLKKRGQQLTYLSDVIEEICKGYSITNRDQIIKNWYRYSELHTTTQQKPISQRSVILGTRCQLHNRKLAINYLQQEKNVLGMTHGEVSNAVFDEPTFSYADCSYCTTLIDYGKSQSFGEFNLPLIAPKSIIHRTSVPIKKVMVQSDNISHIQLTTPRLLYIPTMYSANKLYGPFRNFEDDTYRAWQRIILDLFGDITVKTHPKSLTGWNYNCKTESRTLIDCIADYEGIILDYCSTASTLAFATDRPIIYFDLGLRNLNPEYKQDVKHRCQYIEITNILDEDHTRDEILEKLKNELRKKNSQMMKYSVTEESQDSILTKVQRLI